LLPLFSCFAISIMLVFTSVLHVLIVVFYIIFMISSNKLLILLNASLAKHQS